MSRPPNAQLPEARPAPRAVIAILNFNGQKHLEYSLPAALAQRYSGFEVVVVDNASTDDSRDWLRRTHPDVAVLSLPENVGYSALNAVLSWAGLGDAAFVLLMTNDVKLEPRCLEHAVAVAADPSIGIVGFRMLGATAWIDPSALDEASRELGAITPSPVDWVEGAAMLCRRKLLDDLGGIDPVYFAYCDEDDLQARVRAAGYQVVRIPTPVWHNAGKNALGKVPRRSAYLQMRNDIRYVTKNWGLLRGASRACRVAYLALWPGLAVDVTHPYNFRQRPDSPLRNLPLVVRALAWNLVHLPETLGARDDSLTRVNKVRLTAP